MDVLILSTANPYLGPGIIGLDIFNGLRALDNNVVMLVRDGQSKDQNIISFDSTFAFQKQRVQNKLSVLRKKIKDLGRANSGIKPEYNIHDYDQTITYFSTNFLLKHAKIKPQAIIVLFMQHFLSCKNLYELNQKTGAPIYLFPMDMAPFTGGCHYSWGCESYKNECGSCPALNSQKKNDQTNKNLKFKKNFMQKTDVTLFAGNTQIFDEISNSAIFKNKKVINGIYPLPDKTIFKPISIATSKKHFGIETDKKVFFFGAVSLSDKRKGMSVLIEAIQIVNSKLDEIKYDKDKLLFLIAGSNFHNSRNAIPLNTKEIGYIHGYSDLSKAYNASDFFICPSLEDSGPTMVLQSILCSIPVISFNIGFSRDYIINNVNGYTSQIKNSESLAESLYKAIMLGKKEYETMKSNVATTATEISKVGFVDRIANVIS